jgi:Uri superfamily endonuclease
MGTSKNYAKHAYKGSEMGKLEAFIRRFYNITVLKNALDEDMDVRMSISKIRNDAEKWHIKHTDDFIEVENEFRIKQKEFLERQDAKLLAQMNEEANILRKFEKDFNNKVPQDKK